MAFKSKLDKISNIDSYRLKIRMKNEKIDLTQFIVTLALDPNSWFIQTR